MVTRPRTLAVLTCLPGVGFGLPAVYGAWYLSRHGEIWHLMGFPAYGDGPFEALGVRTTVPLMLGFGAVCAAEAVVGWMFWRRRPAAPRLAMMLLPFELVYWIGFALPFGPVFGVARTALVVFAGADEPAPPESDRSAGERTRRG